MGGALDGVEALLIGLLLERDDLLFVMVMMVFGAILVTVVVPWVFQMLQNTLEGVILVTLDEMPFNGFLIMV